MPETQTCVNQRSRGEKEEELGADLICRGEGELGLGPQRELERSEEPSEERPATLLVWVPGSSELKKGYVIDMSHQVTFLCHPG
eukprot:794778-Amorphochlora_amoeboformis.AAC.1